MQGLQPNVRAVRAAAVAYPVTQEAATTPSMAANWRSSSDSAAAAAGAGYQPASTAPVTRAHSVPGPPVSLARKAPSRECLLPLAVPLRSPAVAPRRAMVASPALPGSGGRAAPGAEPGQASPASTHAAAAAAAVVVPARGRGRAGDNGSIMSPSTSEMAAAAGGLWSLGRERRSPPSLARQGSGASHRSRMGARRRHTARAAAAASGVDPSAPDAHVAGVMAIRVTGYGIPAVAGDGSFVGFYHVTGGRPGSASQLAFTRAAQVAMDDSERYELEQSVSQAYNAFRASGAPRGATTSRSSGQQLLMLKSAGGAYDGLLSLRQNLLQSWRMAEDGGQASAGAGGGVRSGGQAAPSRPGVQRAAGSGGGAPDPRMEAASRDRSGSSNSDSDSDSGSDSDE